jgi:hypothetical protein
LRENLRVLSGEICLLGIRFGRELRCCHATTGFLPQNLIGAT